MQTAIRNHLLSYHGLEKSSTLLGNSVWTEPMILFINTGAYTYLHTKHTNPTLTHLDTKTPAYEDMPHICNTLIRKKLGKKTK